LARLGEGTWSIVNQNTVYCTKAAGTDYYTCAPIVAPELPAGYATTSAVIGLRTLLQQAELDDARYGTRDWNPMAGLIKRGDRVLIKPNWVRHSNGSGQGLGCLVTHPSVIEAVLVYVLKAQPGSVVIGDAPVQGCDFEVLRSWCKLDAMLRAFDGDEVRPEIRDFRRTLLPGGKLSSLPIENNRPLDQYVLFDLAGASDLEAVSTKHSQFRVSMYDPDALGRTHTRGVHQYLIAREAIEADVVINVPKLKTHKKACITGALKNMVGINGHKEYLPHHRKGGSDDGGDCYPGRSRSKVFAENLLDATNRTKHPESKYALSQVYRLTMALGKLVGMATDLEGSWFGNDTVWRMSLDIQRIIHYGQLGGRMSEKPTRRVITITDAIVSGEGDGPLSPTPKRFGVMTLGLNVAALEWVHALLMGFDPSRIPLTAGAFEAHAYSLASFQPEDIAVNFDGKHVSIGDVAANYSNPFRPPEGWRGHCELQAASIGA
jgi:uncharacterized protein (DUF362 family)